MQIGVFDVDWRGHHPSYLPPAVEALSGIGDVTAFVSESLAERVGPLAGRVETLPDACLDPKPQLDALATIASSRRIDHLLHMSGVREVLREWVRRPSLGVPSTVLVIHPAMLHYPSLYETPLTLQERANAWYKEMLVRRWWRRRDAHAVFAMEDPAVERWRRKGGPAFYYPEPPPPVARPARLSAGERRGCALCGALRPSKNVEGVARALALAPNAVEIVIAGEPQAGYEAKVSAAVEMMQASGATVDFRPWWHTSEQLLQIFAQARCMLAPYLRHKGPTHTVVEAAVAGTPVIAHKTGLLGHTVESNGIGVAVDCTDPHALRDAILEFTNDEQAVARYTPALERFADLHSPERFRAAVTAPFVRRS